MTQNPAQKQERDPALDKLAVTTLRMLAIDAIEQANSGHPGLPLGAAPMAYSLWTRILRHNPSDTNWMDRDRFILSAGHGSALLYGLLHLTGYDLSLDDIKAFRQWGSKTPGHPEYGHTPGVEATTGPLGQGFAMGVGMAMAERHLAQNFNRQEYLPIVDHFTYALVSDGDLMEGVAAEAASLAGHLCLGKLIYLYDDNKITIEGKTDLTFSEEVARRFESYQWQVLQVEDGEDLDAIELAIRQGQHEEERPTLIIVRTHIGYGSPKADSAGAHGSPLKGEAMSETRQFYKWPEERFHVPQVAQNYCRKAIDRGQEQQAEWKARLHAFSTQFPEEASRFTAQMQGKLPDGWEQGLNNLVFEDKPLATRSASGKALNAVAGLIPALIGGSADLAPSNNTWMNDQGERNIHFGIREHAMAAICNGMALHKGVIPFCGTFLVFSDYMRGAMRLSALMGTHVTYVLTHDSIAVGEDGPTHQPIEHLATLRALPGLITLRPADAQETAAAWSMALTLNKPIALILSRQDLPVLDPSVRKLAHKGAYVLSDCQGEADILLLATGSEVQLILEAQKQLSQEGHKVRVVSMPSWELFEDQPRDYQDSVLPPTVRARLAVEAGSSLGWHRWIGDQGDLITLDHFGTSAPGDIALTEMGFSVENVLAKARALLA
ncbi:MAG: transketolase [Magnetococcales bacterium]|nr:transketolase [Magnetococcales bacterium]